LSNGTTLKKTSNISPHCAYRRHLRSLKSKQKKHRTNFIESYGLSKYYELVARKKNKGLNQNRSNREVIFAPSAIDIYNSINYEKTVKFFSEIREWAGTRKHPITICFRNTNRITAAACLLLLAETDRILTANNSSTLIKCFKPQPFRDAKNNLRYTVEAVLNQIGFFELINTPIRKIPTEPHVECWMHATASLSDGSIAGPLLDNYKDSLPQHLPRILYRGAIEAISNSVEHAYMFERGDNIPFTEDRWWMFSGIINGRLAVVVCDLGVGIPRTVDKTQSASLFAKVFEKFNFVRSGDSSLIKAATLIKQTRTMEGHRGKGGGDLRKLIDTENTANLNIFSNKGVYQYKSPKTLSSGKQLKPIEVLFDHKRSIFGTVIEWTIELEQS